MLKQTHIPHYLALIRFNKPIGTLLLLWPTLSGLWLAARGRPDFHLVFIFAAGVFIMRSAGCVINDIADRNFDGNVERTRTRPLASQKIPVKEALQLFGLLMLAALILVLFCNSLTIKLAFVGAVLATIYPFLKRVTHLPQLGLGAAFAWSIPMAFAAQTGEVPSAAWLIYVANVIWPIIYDTQYAMADRRDDLLIGVKSTAILFGRYDRLIIAFLQTVLMLLLIVVGVIFQLTIFYYASLIAVILLFAWQQYLIKDRDPPQCFAAFLNNSWVGLIIFIGILMGVS